MIAVDTNILVYAHREELPQHERAKKQLVQMAEGGAAWALPVFCIGEFLRVISHPRVFDPPYSSTDACEALERLLASPSLRVLVPGPNYLSLLTDAIRQADARGNLIFDAQIVAVCRESGVSELLTDDGDFRRFDDFRTRRLEG